MKWLTWLKWIGFEDVVFVLFFLILSFAFIQDFKLNRRRSWLMLAALSGMGLIFWRKTRRKIEILKSLREREETYKKLSEDLERLLKEHKITEEAYRKAKEELELAKDQSARELARLDRELAEKIKEIEKTYDTLSFEDIVAIIEREINQ